MISEQHFWEMTCDVSNTRACHKRFRVTSSGDHLAADAAANGWREIEGEHCCPLCKPVKKPKQTASDAATPGLRAVRE